MADNQDLVQMSDQELKQEHADLEAKHRREVAAGASRVVLDAYLLLISLAEEEIHRRGLR